LIATISLIIQKGCDDFANNFDEFSSSQQIDRKTREDLLALSGTIVPTGNEPFVKVSIRTPEGLNYFIKGDKESELYNAQGKAIRVEGYIETYGSPYSSQYFFVKKYEILDLQSDILSLQIKFGNKYLTIDFADGNYIVSGNKEIIVNRMLLVKLHNSVSGIYQNWLESEEFPVDQNKCYFMLKILYTQRVPITLWKLSEADTNSWIIEQHEKMVAVDSASITNAVVSITSPLDISIGRASQ